MHSGHQSDHRLLIYVICICALKLESMYVQKYLSVHILLPYISSGMGGG